MKTKIFFSRRKAFSLVELFVAMVIIAIFTSFVTSNVTSQSQTAKQETEKLAAYITDLIRKADRRHLSFTINITRIDQNSDEVYVYFNNDKSSPTYIYKKKS